MSESDSERTLSPESDLALHNVSSSVSGDIIEGSTTSTPALDIVDFEDDPELYGLRRSRRAHNAPQRFSIEQEPVKKRSKYIEYSSSDSEGSSQRRRKKSSRKHNSTSKHDEYNYKVITHEDSDDIEEDDDAFTTSKRARQIEKARTKKRRKLMKSGQLEEEQQYAAAMRFSTRNNKVVNYKIDDDDDEFEEQMILDSGDAEQYDYSTTQEPETPVDAIETVLDHNPIDGEEETDPKKGLRYYVSFLLNAIISLISSLDIIFWYPRVHN